MRVFSIAIVLIAYLTFAGAVSAEVDAAGDSLFPGRERRRDPEKEALKAMLAKQQALKDIEDHKEMLDRGEEALKITDEILSDVEKGGKLSADDRRKLASIEKLAVRIRKELGGEDDEEDVPKEAERSSSVQDAVKFLRSTTESLVSELKKTSRFSISAAAIETSNAVIKVARLLRLKD